MLQRWVIGRQTTLALGAGFLLTGLAGGLVAAGFRQATARAAHVSATQEIVARSHLIESRVTEAAAAQRGYVITGDAAFLEAYHAVLAAVPAGIAELRSAVRVPAAADLVDELARGVGLAFAELEAAVGLRRTMGRDAALERVVAGGGEAALDRLRRTFRALDEVEQAVLAERLVAWDRSTRATWFALAGTAALAILSFGSGLLVLNQNVRQRLAAEARVRESERRAAESSLMQSEERYLKVVELNPDGIFINQDGQIAYANPACLRMLGANSPDQVIGRSPLSFIDPAYHAVVEQRIHRMLATGEAVPFIEEQFLRVDGTPVILEIGAAPIPYGDHRAIQVVMRDISDRRRLEEHLRQAQKMEAVGQLAGGIAHDFNNMLTVINGYGEALLRQVPEDHPMAAGLREIVGAGRRSAQVTRQLLAFGRRQVLEPRVLDTNAMVTETARLLKRLIPENIGLTLRLERDVRPVNLDPAQLQQVLINLAVNARDAITGTGQITIETRNAELDAAYTATHSEVTPGTYVMIAVSDTGIGMDAETRARVFEPFFTTKPAGQGTGLGLPTVHGIVKQSGGHIWMYSEPGRGTTFKIYFPAAAGLGEAGSAPVELPPPRGSEAILLVEDERAVRVVTRLTLESFGYRVREAGGGAEALEAVRGEGRPLDLLITDVIMPGMNGREVADAVRRLSPGTRVLYLSGYTDNAILQQGVLEAGAAFLQKPFTAAALGRKVREVLDA
jgi:two-component system cell cycle sensor histidine kinase/response regulator CckA